MTGTDYAGFLAMVSTLLVVVVVLPSVALGWLLRGMWTGWRWRVRRARFDAVAVPALIADRDRSDEPTGI